MTQTVDARISDLLDELDALAAQLATASGGETVDKLVEDVTRARASLSALEGGDAQVNLARLFDVAHQRIAAVLQDHRMTAEERRSLEACAGDLLMWRKELLNGSASSSSSDPS